MFASQLECAKTSKNQKPDPYIRWKKTWTFLGFCSQKPAQTLLVFRILNLKSQPGYEPDPICPELFALNFHSSFHYYLDIAARIPAAQIIQYCEPNPYHISCSISKSSPTMIVCLLPNVFMRQVRSPVWAITERIPMAAMNMATASLEKCITSLKLYKVGKS